jgi:O-antigen chain-terminating methyltransferase
VPGGLLILATPNPENLVVGATSFYMDPSHLRPIPSELLAFVVEYTGFERHKVVRLNETPGIQASDTVGLIQTLDGVSPDYGVIGQKAAPAAMLARFDQPFGSHYGIRLGTLAARFDQQLAARFGKAEDRAGKAEDRAGRAEARLAAAEDRVGRAEADLAQARDHAAQIEARLNQVMSSYSWRIVGRLDRGAQRLVAAVRERRLGDALKRRINAMLKAGLAAFLHSRAGTVSSRSLDRVPRFKAALRRALRPGATPASDPGTHGLSPRAALIYARLKSAVRNRKS